MIKITKIDEFRPLPQDNKTRTAAYCRVSTDSDEQMESLDTQRSHYERYIKTNPEWDFAGVYFDEGVTGTKKEIRKGLMSLISDCEKGLIDLILTKSISRFCRNTTDCLELVRKLLDLNVCIYFEKENLNTGSMESELMLSILGSLAENESVSISENEKWSIKKRFQNGTYVISYPPYGYTNVDRKMVIVPEQAEIVRQIFSDCLDGKSTHLIAKELNERGIIAKKGGKWSSGSVLAIIRNEKYTGDVIFQKTYTDSSFNRHTNYGEYDRYLCKDHHEAIISHKIYDKANELVDRRGQEKGNGTNTERYLNRYEFSGKIKCGECGSSFKRRKHSKPSGNYIAWCCSRHIEDKTACTMKYITDDAVKAAFVTMINKLIFSQQTVLKPLLRNMQGYDEEGRLQQIENIEAGIEKVKEKKQVLVNLMTSGLLEPPIFQKENNALIVESEKLKARKENLLSSVSIDNEKADALKNLIKFVSGHEMLTEYDEGIFESHVREITVISRKEIIFGLHCGLNLKERLDG